MVDAKPENTTYLIRPACLADRDVIVAFNQALALETEGKTLNADVLGRGVSSALDDSDRLRYWVAIEVSTESVVGQAAVTREWTDWRNGWIWWFQSVYVHPDHRRVGVFRALHHSIRDEARQLKDVIGLRLYVEHANTRAQATYESLGLVSAGYLVHEEIWRDRFDRS